MLDCHAANAADVLSESSEGIHVFSNQYLFSINCNLGTLKCNSLIFLSILLRIGPSLIPTVSCALSIFPCQTFTVTDQPKNSPMHTCVI